MENIIGKIEKLDKSEGIGKNGKPFTRFVFLINGKKYSTFDEKIGSSFKVGDNVEMTGQQNGQYWNMETMKKTDKAIPMQTIKEEDLAQPQTTNDILMRILNVLEDIRDGYSDN